MEFRLSEIVREKIFIHTNDEVPHSITCKLIGYEEGKNIVKVSKLQISKFALLILLHK